MTHLPTRSAAASPGCYSAASSPCSLPPPRRRSCPAAPRPRNSYSTTWSGIGDFVAGVGWNPGSNQTVSFTGGLSASGGTSLVSLYGWSTNPLVEYYVMENYNGSPPTA